MESKRNVNKQHKPDCHLFHLHHLHLEPLHFVSTSTRVNSGSKFLVAQSKKNKKIKKRRKYVLVVTNKPTRCTSMNVCIFIFLIIFLFKFRHIAFTRIITNEHQSQMNTKIKQQQLTKKKTAYTCNHVL